MNKDQIRKLQLLVDELRRRPTLQEFVAKRTLHTINKSLSLIDKLLNKGVLK